MTDDLHASLILGRTPKSRMGADRIALIEAIRDTGSISAAARDVGLSYKAAWDAVQVVNNLFDQPLVLPSTGGRAGGTSRVTPAGEAVIRTFRAVEGEMAAMVARLEAGLAAGVDTLAPIFWGTGMKTSARNAIRGTVSRITTGDVDAEVVLAVADGVEIVATITRGSAEHLGLTPGVPAIALIKASSVILAADDGLRTSARNALTGTVVAREDGTVASEITLELAEGRTLTATLTRGSAETLDLTVGKRAQALIKASHVILAVD
jgi:molybdate transport system regulatory protein